MFFFPKPKSVEIRKGEFLPLKQGDVILSPAGIPQGAKVKLDLTYPSPCKEAYELDVSKDGITIRTSGEEGARMAFQTLRQAIAQGTKDGVQCLKIVDEPTLKIRGFMLDISRCKVPTMQTLAYLVDLLSLFKFNRLELYTEHTFAFQNHELVWGDSTPMTPQQYKILDALCARANIELVPNLNSLGHMDRWLRYPEYRHLAECEAPFLDPMGNERPYPTTLYPSKESLDFIGSLYDDFLPNFTSKNFNAGCDEPWEFGTGRSKEECDKIGKYKVYANYVKELSKLAKNHGKRIHIWADVILEEPEFAKELPEDLVALLWGYYPDSPIDEEAKILHDQKRDFIVVGGTNTWNSFAIRLDTAYQNVKDVCSSAKKWGAMGAMLTNWGDNGNHQAWCAMWLAILAFAQSAWGDDFEESDVCKAADMFVFQDPTGNMSKAITELGRCDPAKKLHSLHNKLFFANSNKLKELKEQGAAEHFKSMFEGANKAIEFLSKAEPHSPDAEVCKGEIALAADLIKWTVARASDDDKIQSLNLRKTLKVMRSQYEQIWLARARIGGLFESSMRAFANRTEE